MSKHFINYIKNYTTREFSSSTNLNCEYNFSDALGEDKK